MQKQVDSLSGGVAPVDGGQSQLLPFLLLAAFRSLVDELHADLARRGHDRVRPVHGFALQAVGRGATTTADLARRLGISKQAAGKTVRRLEQLGYLSVSRDPADGRARPLHLTARGRDLLQASADILVDIWLRWQDRLGAGELDAMQAALAELAGGNAPPLRLDLPGWLDGPAGSK